MSFELPQRWRWIRSCFLLLALLGCTAPSFAGDRQTTLLSVRVEDANCTPLKGGKLGGALKLSVSTKDESGGAVVSYPQPGPALGERPAWRSYRVPRGCEVRLSVYSPPHPLLERVFVLDANVSEKRVRLSLAEPVPIRSLGVQVEFPSQMTEGAGSFHLNLLAPQTGHILQSSGVAEARSVFRVPAGTYGVVVMSGPQLLCIWGTPTPEWIVRERKEVVVPRPAPGASERDGVRVILHPKRGARLALHVIHPGPLTDAEDRVPPDSPNTSGAQHQATDPRELVSARLVSKDGERKYNLTWGWAEAQNVIAWDEFSMGRDVFQMVPVPSGEYELTLRGPAIAELRQKVLLVDGEVLTLRLAPEKCTPGDK